MNCKKTAEIDINILSADLSWGKYVVVVQRNRTTWMYTASHGLPYQHIWSARAFGLKHKGYEKPTLSNGHAKAVVLDIQTGEIVWRNYT